MSTLRSKLPLSVAVAALLCPAAARAVGEQGGRIAGVLTDAKTRVPIPGATIRVSGPALIGGPQLTATDESGAYELANLPPGRYDVEVSIEGARPLQRRVVVRQGETMPLDIAWSVELTQTQTTVIVEERRLTKPDSTQTGTVLDFETQARVASGRRYQDVVGQVAGVSNLGNANPNIKGGFFRHNRYLVDGMDITDPVSSTFSANINFDSIASVEVLTGGMEAQYNSLGGVINLVTAQGGNKWSVDSSLYVNNVRLSAGRQFGANLWNDSRPFADFDPPPQQSYQANLNVGGPLVKNRLWANLSFEYFYQEASIPIGPPLGVQTPPRFSHRYLARLKLTYAPSARHRLTWSTSADPAFFNNLNQSNDLLAVAQQRQNQGGVFTILQWDWFLRENVNFNLQTGFQLITLDNGPQGILGAIDPSGYAGTGRFSAQNDVYDPMRPRQSNLDDGTLWYNGTALVRDRRYTVQLDPSLSLRGRLLGTHDAKIGIQSRYVRHTFSQAVPGGRTYASSGGGPQEGGLCNELSRMAGEALSPGCFQRTDTPDFDNFQQGFGIGAFAQDRWRVWKRLLLLPGLRFDFGHTRNSVGETVSNLWGFGPRIGFSLDLTGDQKTILTGFYGRANETLSLQAAASADVTALSQTSQVNRMTGAFEPLFTSGGARGYRIAERLSPPRSDEVTASLRREVFASSMAGVDYTFKRIANMWDNVEVNQIWDPTGARVVGYDNGAREQIFLHGTREELWRDYHGVDFLFESRPRQEWDFLVVYTLSFLYGTAVDQLGGTGSPLYNPRQTQLFDGFLPEDRRHQLKLRASYNWRGLNVGVTFNYATGTPLTKLYFNRNDAAFTLRRSPTGTDPSVPNDPQAIAEFRTPDLVVVDARVSYDLHGLIRQHVLLIADLFNVFNLGGVGNPLVTTPVENRDVPTFGQVRARQQPLRFQVGLRYFF